MALAPDVLKIDAEQTSERIVEWLRDSTARRLRKRGLVVGISGGIDSAVCAKLAVRAVGPERVFGLLMPERDSSRSGLELGQKVADEACIPYEIIDITAALEAIGCYSYQHAAIQRVFPDFTPSWKSKLVIAGAERGELNHFNLVVQAPDSPAQERRLRLAEYLQIVAATNFKQRVRKMLEYFHADRLNYAVIGTPNRLEYDQGFFVKNGDGSADLKPIAHLYKTQVYALGRFLGVPEEICRSRPTTDTYSLQQGQDEFYFGLPYEKMDFALWCYNHNVPAIELAVAIEISQDLAFATYEDIASKRRSTRYQHLAPLVVEPIADVGENADAYSVTRR